MYLNMYPRPMRPISMQRTRLRQIGILFLTLLLWPADQLSAQNAAQNPGQSPGQSAAASAQAQAAASASSVENGAFVFHTRVEEVVLNVTVTDKHQKLVTTLTKPDFTVWEDNVPQKITAFRREDLPI